MSRTNFDLLNSSGLNMQAVFNLCELSEDIRTQLGASADRDRQLILIGHGGKQMWEAVRTSSFSDSAEPIDSFSVETVRRWFAEALAGCSFEIIYPASQRRAPLQKLGELAGWHHASPFKVGINARWGSWFAYRVVAVADSALEPTQKTANPSPCHSCLQKPCITACPANALSGDDTSLKPCLSYRLTENSRCRDRCLSRISCPVAAEHAYSMQQLNYHYARSMQSIEAHLLK